jgi:hypothetical protein
LPNGRTLTGTTTSGTARQRCLRRSKSLPEKSSRLIKTVAPYRVSRLQDSVTAAFPNRQLHVVLDNLNTHKKNEHWLKAHPNVQFHFTPTGASWLSQVEVWFSILHGQSLGDTSFTSH